MKLNKNGWSTTELLVLSGGLLIALLVAVFFIYRLYDALGKDVRNNYRELEENLAIAGEKYVEENYINVDDTFKVSAEILRLDGYITDLKDQNGNLCTGYVRANNVNNNITYKGYIRCNDYETTNYS